jgi:HEPN domain-containing protein
MRLEDIVKEWVELGKQDLATAQFLLTMRPVPLEIVGFLCQQSVEKHLKAYLIQNGQEPDKTHNLVFLLASCEAFTADFRVLSDNCSQLNMYAVKTRYPYPENLDLEMIKMALSRAQDVVKAITNHLRVE